MSQAIRIPALVLTAALLWPAYAQAAVHLSLNFSGIVSPGSTGESTAFSFEDMFNNTSFDGQPVTISMSVTGTPGHLYVDQFSANWSNATYTAPFVTNWYGTGLPTTPSNDFVSAFFSTVSLDSQGGAISIFPTFEYQGFTDNDFVLHLNYTLSSPHNNPLSDFSDGGVAGGGDIRAYIADGDGYPFHTYFTGESRLNFTLTGMSQSGPVPEPSVWAMLLLGFGALGAAARRRRSLLRAA